MTGNRRAYLKRARKARRRELKPSPQGICACFLAFGSAALLVCSIVFSFLANGEGSFEVGTLGLLGLFVALAGWFLAARSLKNPKLRPGPAKVGRFLSILLVVILVILYVMGVLT